MLRKQSNLTDITISGQKCPEIVVCKILGGPFEDPHQYKDSKTLAMLATLKNSWVPPAFKDYEIGFNPSANQPFKYHRTYSFRSALLKVHTWLFHNVGCRR